MCDKHLTVLVVVIFYVASIVNTYTKRVHRIHENVEE